MTTPVIDRGDIEKFAAILHDYRRTIPEKWRNAVCARAESFDPSEALAALAGIIVEEEAFEASILSDATLFSDSSDYGEHVFVGARGELKPVEEMTILLFMKMVPEILGHQDRMIAMYRDRARRADTMLSSWVKMFVEWMKAEMPEAVEEEPVIISKVDYEAFRRWQESQCEMED
jgi:hypothetical protein